MKYLNVFDFEREFCVMLDETYPTITIFDTEYYPSDILKKMDTVLYMKYLTQYVQREYNENYSELEIES